MGTNIKGRFADQDSYLLGTLLQTVTSNAADLNVITQESDYLRSTSVYYNQQAVNSNLVSNVPNAQQVATQTTGSAISDGTLSPSGEPIPERNNPNCPEVNQFVWIRGDDGVPTPVRAGTITLGQFLYNWITETFEEVVHAEIVASELWEVITPEQCKFMGSPTTPIIRSRDDVGGLALKECHIGTKAMAVIDREVKNTDIRTIVKRKARGFVNHLTTAGPTHVYSAGSRSDKVLIIDNLKPQEEF